MERPETGDTGPVWTEPCALAHTWPHAWPQVTVLFGALVGVGWQHATVATGGDAGRLVRPPPIPGT